MSPYECGIVPETDAKERFPVKFFLIAIDFVVFGPVNADEPWRFDKDGG